METRNLIAAMAADGTARDFRRRWMSAALGAVLVAALVFALALRPRADLAEALAGARMLAKLGLALGLALTALPLVRAAARPGAPLGAWPLALLPALALAVGVEWQALPEGQRWAAMMGRHNLACLGLVGLIGIGPLAVFLAFLRQGAPTRPRLAGAVAGLASGGIAASLYALHCTDDSPLFVATWYVLAVAGLAALGALIAPRLLRW